MFVSPLTPKSILVLLCSIMFTALILPVRLLAASDVVIMKNGDRITGDVKKLNNGDLEIDPPYSGTNFILEWKQVERIESKATFIAQTSAGDYVTGSVRTDPEDSNQVFVEGETEVLPVEHSELVYLKPVDEGFWGRLSASIDFGLSLTKADGTRQMNTRGTVGYLTEDWSTSVQVDALRNVRDDADTTKRSEVAGDYRYYFAGNWFALGTASFLQSNELQLDLRSTVGGGVGNYLVRNNRWLFSAQGGAGWTNENYIDADPTAADRTSGEGFAGVELNVFDIGSVDILSSFTVIPSFTESGRFRMDFRTDFQWELIKNLFFRVGFTDNYDNSPVGDAPSNDWVFSTSVGWSK
ncbi:MAG TPA: DUF481 domain-containing protein [Acidobacteriota bacterium]|nr:DUF481 domain-containing protein [Acidobacteriota bacterium]